MQTKLKSPEEKEKYLEYNDYQENLAFTKELNILRNDFYYQMTSVSDASVSLVDFLYKPLDMMSGDAYTARKVDEFKTFYLVVDGMGKGLSASLTAMIMTSFINHLVDKMIEHDQFDLYLLVFESLHYIQKILLDEEALAIDYIVVDDEIETLSYAKFAMPVSLLQTDKNEIVRLQSNNPPMSKYQNDFKVSNYDIKEINKFLFYSDGIVENRVKCSDKTYADFIEKDFKDSLTREEITEKIFKRLDTQEDDLTLIFINKLNFKSDTYVSHKTFETSLESVEKASEWYSSEFSKLSDNQKVLVHAEVVFTELFMNAYEHGNLGISSSLKHKLLDEDKYFETLIEKEQGCTKKITVKIDRVIHLSDKYIVTQICDEGEGFDTQILSEIFRNSETFNGRGVYVSRKNSLGIYYNAQGNRVLYLNKV